MDVSLIGRSRGWMSPDAVRVSARVDYQSRFARPDTLWFEVPVHLSSQITERGDPWLVALLPLAVTLQEEIRLNGLPVDPGLRSNLDSLMSVWNDWYPRLTAISIRSDVAAPEDAGGNRRYATFFSGGVDSFYSVQKEMNEGVNPIDELIFIHGFDIPIDHQRGFDLARALVERAADSYGLPVTVIRTNLRTTRIGGVEWTHLASGPALAASALILEPRYGRVLIPSTGRRQTNLPVGTHPRTDPLLSTSKLSFVHHGSGVDRIGKTAYISNDPVALQNLRVCWESKDGANCGRCSKCLRTMATLEAFDRLSVCPAFPHQTQLADQISRLYLGHELPFMLQVYDLAVSNQKHEIARAITVAVQRTRRINQWGILTAVDGLRERMSLNWMGRTLAKGLYQILKGAAIWLNRRIP